MILLSPEIPACTHGQLTQPWTCWLHQGIVINPVIHISIATQPGELHGNIGWWTNIRVSFNHWFLLLVDHTQCNEFVGSHVLPQRARGALDWGSASCNSVYGLRMSTVSDHLSSGHQPDCALLVIAGHFSHRFKPAENLAGINHDTWALANAPSYWSVLMSD